MNTQDKYLISKKDGELYVAHDTWVDDDGLFWVYVAPAFFRGKESASWKLEANFFNAIHTELEFREFLC